MKNKNSTTCQPFLCVSTRWLRGLIPLLVWMMWLIPTSVTAQNQAPNCSNFSPAIDSNGKVFVSAGDFLTNVNKVAFPVEVSVKNSWNGFLTSFTFQDAEDVQSWNVCKFLGQKLGFSAKNGVQQCNLGWIDLNGTPGATLISALTDDSDETYISANKMVVYCGMEPDPEDPRYRPTATAACDGYVSAINAQPDWIDIPADRTCGENDTARVIRRVWEVFDRTGKLTTMVDTIVVMRLPKLTAASFVGKMADTIACSLQQVSVDGAAPFQYSAWKQEVGIHSYELPNAQLGALIYELPASVVELGCNLAADCGKSAEYLAEVILIKADGTEVTIGDILDGSYWSDESSHLTSQQLAYPSVQEIYLAENQATACGQTYPPYLLLRSGDQVLSDNGEFVEVTGDWFYNGHSQPTFWFSGAWPVGCSDQDCISFCDISSAPEEKGCFQIVVPALSAESGFLDECDTICLPVGQNCGIFVDDGKMTEVNDCPSYSGGHTTVTQTCWAKNGEGVCNTSADPNDEDTWADVVSGWNEYDNNNDGVTDKQTFDLYRKTYYVDDIPPIFEFCYSRSGCGPEDAGTPEDFVLAGEQHPCAREWEAANPVIYTTGSHDCVADIFVPDVKVIDNCSGIYQVKARVETGSGVRMVSLELTDEEEIRTEDGSICTVYTYSHLENAIRLPFRGCEGEAVEVIYEAADNCWNVSEWSKFVKVLDGTPPVIVTDDEVNVTLSNEITLVEATTFDEGSWDNCSISLLATRRTDWTTAQIDICNNISSDLDGVADILVLLGVNPSQANAAVNGNPVGNPTIDVGSWAEVLSGFFADYYLGEILDLWFESGLSGAKLVHGWLYELTHYIGENCSGVQPGELADLNRIFDFLFDEPGYGSQLAQLGGGWTVNVPLVCEDACEQVPVELIGLDQCSNWRTGKSLAYIEAIDNAAVSEPLADLEISCEAYNIFYYQLAEEAAGYASSSEDSTGIFTVLDSLFGTYSMSAGNGEATSRFEYNNIICLETGDDPVTNFDTLPVVGQNGVISSACGGSFVQNVTLELDSCGQGRIVRRFYVSGGCSDSNSRATEIKQVISVKSACPMQESMFDTPVQVGTKNDPVCLSQSLSNSYFPDTLGELALKEHLEGALCNSIAIGYDVKEFDVEDYPDVKLYKITWTAVDWCCANESPDRELTFVQKVLATIDPDCDTGDDNSEGSSLVKGDIATETGKAIGEVAMKAVLGSGSPMTMVTGDDGSYRFSVNNGWQVSLIPEKNTAFSEGVTTMDLIAVQRHLLNKKPLESKYQRIAADVNKNGRIDVFDITELRRIILNPKGEFAENTSWRFFDKNTDREVYEVAGLSNDVTVDWIGVKIGDVNGSILDGDLASSGRSGADALHLNVADRTLRAGETYRVEVTSDNFADITGWQYTLSYLSGQVTVESIEAGALPLTADHWHRYAPGLVTMSWHDAGAQNVSRDEVLFTIVLKANSSISLKEALSLNGRVTPAQAYDAADRLKDIRLRFGAQEGDFALYQNSPNPFDGQTIIGFRLPEASEATLSVYDVTGRLLKLVEGEFAEGYNEVRLQAGDLNAVGILYYQLDTKTYTATKKMVVME